MKKILFSTIAFCSLTFAQDSLNTDSIQQLEEVNLIYKATESTPVTYQKLASKKLKINLSVKNLHYF